MAARFNQDHAENPEWTSWLENTVLPPVMENGRSSIGKLELDRMVIQEAASGECQYRKTSSGPLSMFGSLSIVSPSSFVGGEVRAYGGKEYSILANLEILRLKDVCFNPEDQHPDLIQTVSTLVLSEVLDDEAESESETNQASATPRLLCQSTRESHHWRNAVRYSAAGPFVDSHPPDIGGLD
ncbi:hypothetical protein C8J56DRAFT_1057489 [Mycena floridula]|nr:hypothetical protein C8J56DRAFT_1057489 [Mycena floridula]